MKLKKIKKKNLLLRIVEESRIFRKYTLKWDDRDIKKKILLQDVNAFDIGFIKVFEDGLEVKNEEMKWR